MKGIYAAIVGLFLGLSLLKFGNPVILWTQISPPTNIYEWLLATWPVSWGMGLLAAVALLGLLNIRLPSRTPRWVILAPLPWFAWQLLSFTGTVDRTLSTYALLQFTANVTCFYIGLLGIGSIHNLRWFWAALMGGFGLVLLNGWQQYFGGLEATREVFWAEIYPHMAGDVPEELLKRMSSDRIFATLCYPNALAGIVLLLTPISAGVAPTWLREGPTRRITLAVLWILAIGCLVWSGSKAGWLLALGLGLLALLRLDFPLSVKWGLMVLVFVAGTAGFVWKYSDYLRRGATSAVARFDYWEAAVQTAKAHPLRGTGPGTFGPAYKAIKRPESEMARLTHNDFLEQASDSGWPGFIFFGGFVSGIMVYLGKRVWRGRRNGHFWVWLGLLGIWLQSLVEFGFYIPGIAWPTMTCMGWLIAATNDLDKRDSSNLPSQAR